MANAANTANTASTIIKCPRCNHDVQILEHRISQCICGMSLDEGNGRFWFTISDKRLTWRVDKHDVVLWRLHAVNDENVLSDIMSDPTKLPWLPFDITEERLKLFLVFS